VRGVKNTEGWSRRSHAKSGRRRARERVLNFRLKRSSAHKRATNVGEPSRFTRFVKGAKRGRFAYLP
jgi:hypothetical protein